MKKIITLLVAITLAGTGLAQEDKDTWNLGDLYPSVEAWYKAKQELEAGLSKIDQCQGQLGTSAAKLLECSKLLSDTFKTFSINMMREVKRRACGEEPNLDTCVSRKEDMSPDGELHLLKQPDGDIVVVVETYTNDFGNREEYPIRAQVEFCSPGGGGGRSPMVLNALRLLFDIMSLENKTDPNPIRSVKDDIRKRGSSD